MNLQENIQRIKEMMGINEIFDTGEMPELVSKDKVEGKIIYHYTLPSKKSDENYHIKLSFYKNLVGLNLKNVLELEFGLGESGMGYTGLNEIFYLFTSINKVIEKHKKDFKYLIVYSSMDRLSLYEKAMSRINFLTLVKKDNRFLLYENNDFSKWF